MTDYVAYQILGAAQLNASFSADIAAAVAGTAAEAALRVAGDATEAAARAAAVSAEATARTNAIATETAARIAADAAEVTARTAAINAGVVGTANITANPSIAVAPVGNAFATLGSFAQTGTTTSTTLREFAGSFGLESYTGYGGVGAYGIRADKVALYSGIEGFANSADIWALNTLTRLAPGFPAASNSIGYELDFNNQAGNRGATDGLAGFAAPTATGLLVTGSGTYSSTAGISVQGASNTQWYRGIGVASGVSSVAFYDYSTSVTGFSMQATHVGWGIDMRGSVLGGAIRVPNNSGIYARNNADTADYAMMTVDTAGNMEIGVTSGGTGNVAGIYAGSGILPFVDNAYAFGSTGRRWTTIYAATGTINTSDARLKTDIADVPPCLPIVMALQPKTYKWTSGGIDIVDGVSVSKPGKRTHWGFMADQVKAAAAPCGIDFAGYVKSPDGVEGTRPDELLAVLWGAVRELSAQVTALQAAIPKPKPPPKPKAPKPVLHA